MNDPRPYDEELPWLQPVEDEDEPRGLSASKMLAALSVVILAIAIVAGTFFWLGRGDSSGAGPPELIKAPPGPYKVKSDDRGGLDIGGESQTAFETSAGEDPDAKLDLSRIAPAGPRAEATLTDAKPLAGAPKPDSAAKPSPEQPKAAAAAGSTVQLGAFKNRQQAERAWSALAARFPAVAALDKLVVPFAGGIRLRASASSPAAAKEVCRTLASAGENCFVAN